MYMLKRIEREIKRAAERKGINLQSGVAVTISMILTSAEKSEFLELDLNECYYWELDDNELILTYKENTITLEQIIKNIKSLDITGLEESDIINEIIIAYQDYQVHGVSEVVVSCEHKNNGTRVYQVYQSYINHTDSPILKTVVSGDAIECKKL